MSNKNILKSTLWNFPNLWTGLLAVAFLVLSRPAVSLLVFCPKLAGLRIPQFTSNWRKCAGLDTIADQEQVQYLAIGVGAGPTVMGISQIAALAAVSPRSFEQLAFVAVFLYPYTRITSLPWPAGGYRGKPVTNWFYTRRIENIRGY